MANRFGDDQIQPGAATNRFGDPAASAAAPAASRSWIDQLKDIPAGIWDSFVQGGEGLIEATKVVGDTIAHPIETAKGNAGVTKLLGNIGSAQDTVRLKAEDAFKRGDYATGVRHVLNYLLPVLGPGIDAQGDLAQEGQWGRATGQAIGTGAQLAAPSALKGAGVKVTPRITNPNAAEASAMTYLEGKGVPVSAAARTGNPYVRGVQKAVDSTPVGAVVAQRADAATTKALQAESSNLAQRAYSSPIVPEQAGESLHSAVGATAARHATEADMAYSTMRQIEQRPSSLRRVQVGTRNVDTGVVDANGQPIMRAEPVFDEVAMPANVSGIKAQLKPIFDDMMRWMEPAKRNASAGFQAIKSILDGPDVIPASRAEAGLGGLKQLGREGSGRNAGLAKFVIPKLQAEIDRAVGAVDQSALVELQKGRAATAAQYGTQAVLDQLRVEPVQAFGQMVYAKDAGIGLLRKVAKEAPGELPKIGRAYLEDLFSKAQAQGGWNGADGLFAQWQKLGPQTKHMLFQSPGMVDALDNFFLGAKKIAENPNPSGSAIVGFIGTGGTLAIMHPTVGVPVLLGAGALSKLMHSPAGVSALMKGLRMPLKAPGAALAAGQLLKMAGPGVRPIELPAAAENNQPGREVAMLIGRE